VVGRGSGAGTSTASSPDRRLLASASYDLSVRLWKIDPDRAAARACEIAHPVITRQEWDTYFPG
jgi:WD40 repeat protein